MFEYVSRFYLCKMIINEHFSDVTWSIHLDSRYTPEFNWTKKKEIHLDDYIHRVLYLCSRLWCMWDRYGTFHVLEFNDELEMISRIKTNQSLWYWESTSAYLTIDMCHHSIVLKRIYQSHCCTTSFVVLCAYSRGLFLILNIRGILRRAEYNMAIGGECHKRPNPRRLANFWFLSW